MKAPFCLSDEGHAVGMAALICATSPDSVPANVVIIALCPYPNSTSLTIVELICVVSFPITLFEGWLQSELMVGKKESPQNRLGFGEGLVQESLVHRKVARFLFVRS